MAAALVQVCVDPRLNHELIRIQVRQRLERSAVRSDRLFILNGIGGNLSSSFRDTIQLLSETDEPILFSAVLHHDDCLAAYQGLRTDLDATAQRMVTELSRAGVVCPVATGQIQTEHNRVYWSDEPVWSYVPFTFGAG